MIFLDMDGVLCDFVGASLRVHGREHLLDSWPPGEWDVAQVLGISTADFWAMIDAEGVGFWADLRPYPWARDLVADLERLGTVVVCSSPSASHYSAAGKVVWLQRNFPQFAVPSRFIFTERKDLVAGRGRVLLDDNPLNVDAWRICGGEAVLFPQPWNGRQTLGDGSSVAWSCADRVAAYLSKNRTESKR